MILIGGRTTAYKRLEISGPKSGWEGAEVAEKKRAFDSDGTTLDVLRLGATRYDISVDARVAGWDDCVLIGLLDLPLWGDMRNPGSGVSGQCPAVATGLPSHPPQATTTITHRTPHPVIPSPTPPPLTLTLAPRHPPPPSPRLPFTPSSSHLHHHPLLSRVHLLALPAQSIAYYTCAPSRLRIAQPRANNRLHRSHQLGSDPISLDPLIVVNNNSTSHLVAHHRPCRPHKTRPSRHSTLPLYRTTGLDCIRK